MKFYSIVIFITLSVQFILYAAFRWSQIRLYFTWKHFRTFLMLGWITWIGSLVFVCHKTGYEERIQNKLFSRETEKVDRNREKELLNFNNEPLSVVNDTLDIGSRKYLSIVFLGNSLTYCGTPDEFKDKTRRGLASTSLDKDYVHQLVRMIAYETNSNIAFSYTNISEFERHCDKFNSQIKLDSIKIKTPNYLIVQIGENVPSNVDSLTYASNYITLLKIFDKSKRIITLPFMYNAKQNRITTDVALATNSYICDLSHLFNERNNLAGTFMKFSKPGVDIHPSDIGMHEIARSYFSLIKTIETKHE